MRHVAFNAMFLDPGRSGGPETYLRGLLPAIAAQRPELDLTILTTRRGAQGLAVDGWTDFATLVGMPADEGERGRRLSAEVLLAPVTARRRRADVLHSLASTGPFAPRLKTVVTVHDVTFLHMPTFPRSTTIAMGALMAGAAHTADGLIAVSAAARDDICATLRLDPARVRVVPNGHKRTPVTPKPNDLGIAGRVVLTVAAIRPHKNQALLAHALPHLPADVHVVLCGAQEPYADEVRAIADGLGVGHRLHLPGYVDAGTLEGLWDQAACAALPTLGEGFGLPALEALDRGLGLACSDLGVLREVAGDAAEYFDPHDARSAAAAILRALDAPSGDAGRAQAARFTWEAAARGTLAAYDAL